MVREDKATWKGKYFLKLAELLENYPKLFIVGVDNVGSKQMQEIRIAMRGRAEILMGKNTMIRKAIRGHIANNPSLEKCVPPSFRTNDRRGCCPNTQCNCDTTKRAKPQQCLALVSSSRHVFRSRFSRI